MRLFINVKDEDQLKSLTDVKDGNGQELSVYFDLQDYSPLVVSNMNNLLNVLAAKKYFVNVDINCSDAMLTRDNLENLQSVLRNKNVSKVTFSEGLSGEYSFDEIINANNNMWGFVDAVKALDLSPFERLILAYQYVSSRKYKESEMPENSRRLINVLNGDDIVCVGYASLLERILKNLDIDAYSQIVAVLKKNRTLDGMHKNNLVYLEDEKYKIKGWYDLDACWDSIVDGEEPFLSFLFFMTPISDSKKYKKYALDYRDPFSCCLRSKLVLQDKIEGFLLSNWPEDYFKLLKENKTYESFKVRFDEKVKIKIMEVCDKLSLLMHNSNIRADFYKNTKMPKNITIDFLIANLMMEKPIFWAEDTMAMLDVWEELRLEEQEEYGNLMVVDIDNVYSYLKDLKSYLKLVDCDVDYLRDDKLNKIIELYQRFSFAVWLQEQNKLALKDSTVITVEMFRRAIEEINLKQGTSVAFAKKQAERTIDYNVKRIEKSYSQNALNGFVQEALKRRLENKL